MQDPNTNKKYFKRGELLAKEQEEYLKKYGPQVSEPEDNKPDINNEKGYICLHIFFYKMLNYDV